MTDERQIKTLAAPDPARPGLVFRDGEYVVSLAVLPAALPIWLAPSGRGLDDALWNLAAQGVASRVDRRWKVVTSRHRRPRLPQVVALELCETEEAAQARRVELLRAWVPGSAATARPIGVRERRLRRRT